MKKRHYLLLSEALLATRPRSAPLTDPLQLVAAHRAQWEKDVTAIANALTVDNPRTFDRALFLTNSGAAPLTSGVQ